MDKQEIKVVQYGLGPIGLSCVRAVTRKPNLRLVGAIDIDPEKVGKDVAALLNLEHRTGVVVRSDAPQTLQEARPDVVLHTTQSFVPAVYDQLVHCIEAGAHVVSSTEELYWPTHRHPDLARRLDELAVEKGVVIVGTGVNPGFVMDTLVLILTSQCLEVRKVFATRVVDASKRRLPLQRKIGAGLSEPEFRSLVSQGKLGHIGLVESLVAVAQTLGWKLNDLKETLDPMIAERDVATPYLQVQKGQVAGIRHVCRGYVGEDELLTLDLRMYVGAEDPRDEIIIDGDPPVHAILPGGVFGDTATVANLINAIPRVLRAQPGLRTVMELSTPCAFLV